MIKVKKKKAGKPPTVAPSTAHTAEEDSASTKRHRDGVNSRDLHVQKKPKVSSSSSPSACSKAAPAAAPSSAPSKIQLGEGSVDCERLERAVRALCRHVQKQHSEQEVKDLLGGGGGPTVCLMFSLHRIPDGQRIYPHLIKLPHSPHDATAEACLIVRDPQRKWKDAVAACASSLSFVSRVISYKKLPKKYPQFIDKRNLCNAYDLFLVDTTVKEKVYNTLGKIFHSANKLPLPIRVGTSTLQREVLKAYKSTPLVIRRGPSVAVRIGKALGAPDEIYMNAVAAIEGVYSFFKENNKWRNTITTIHIQATNTPALPVYIHPKYTQSAEYYLKNKPPQTDINEKNKTNTQEEQTETKKNKQQTQYIHQVADTRKIKRGEDPNKAKEKNDREKPKKEKKKEKKQKEKQK